MNIETYNFSHTNAGCATTTISFAIPTEGLTIKAFHQLCKQAAASFGYCESNIESVFGPSFDEAFSELNGDPDYDDLL